MTQVMQEWRLHRFVDAVVSAGDGNVVAATSNLTGSTWDGRVFGISGKGSIEAEIELECGITDLCEMEMEGQFLSACDDGSIRVFHLGGAQKISGGHNGVASCVAVSGNVGATGGEDRVIQYYDLEKHTQEPTRVLSHTDSVNSVDWHGDTLVSASSDGTVRVWDTRNKGSITPVCAVALGSVAYCACFIHSGERIVVGTESNELVCFDIRSGSGTPLWTEFGLKGPARRLRQSPHHSHILAAATDSPSVLIVNLETGRIEDTLKHHRDFVRALSWDKEQPGRLYCGSWDKTVTVIQVATP